MLSSQLLKRDMAPGDLQRHILSTYFDLRIGIGVIGILFPLFLWLGGGFWAALPLQDSMSRYYYAVGPTGESMRDWFVGLLFAVGNFLYLYKGFGRAENWALNIGGVLALGVAIIPMNLEAKRWLTPHGVCAIGLFLCMAFVALCCAGTTLDLIKDERTKRRFKHTYRVIGISMVVFILAAYVLNTLFATKYRTFWVEAAGIVSFGTYWLVKSREMRLSAAEVRAASGHAKKERGHLSIAPPAAQS